MEEKIITEFVASLPPVDSAIQLNGLGDGGKLKIDFSATETEKVIKMPKGQTFILRVIQNAKI